MFDTMCFQAPLLTLYFFVTGAMEGLPFKDIYAKTQANFHVAWAYAFLVWAPVQTVNFLCVPVARQALFVNSVNTVWQTFLSLLYHSRDYGDHTAEDEHAHASAPSRLASISDSELTSDGIDKPHIGQQRASAELEAELCALRQELVRQQEVIARQAQLIKEWNDLIPTPDRTAAALVE